MVRNLSMVTSAPARTAEPTTSKPKSTETNALIAQTSGNSLPKRGQELPSAARVDPIDVARAVERLNQLAQETSRDLQFRLDDQSGRMVITVVNSTTQEVIRQIPPEEILNAARALGSAGTLVDAEI